MPYGTPPQRDLFDDVAAGHVHGYPGWSKPKFFRKRTLLDNTEVPRVQRLLDAGIVAWEPAWREGADEQARYLLQPTDDVGWVWRKQIAEREQRAAERQANR